MDGPLCTWTFRYRPSCASFFRDLPDKLSQLFCKNILHSGIVFHLSGSHNANFHAGLAFLSSWTVFMCLMIDPKASFLWQTEQSTLNGEVMLPLWLRFYWSNDCQKIYVQYQLSLFNIERELETCQVKVLNMEKSIPRKVKVDIAVLPPSLMVFLILSGRSQICPAGLNSVRTLLTRTQF